MATSMAAAAQQPGAQSSPNVVQSPWTGSPATQSPNLPAQQQGPGVGADAASFFASRPMPHHHQPNGTQHQPPTAPSPQTVAPTQPPAGSPAGPPAPPLQSFQRQTSQDSASSAPSQQHNAPTAPVRSDMPPGTQQAFDKAHTEQYTSIASVIKSADRSVLRQVIRDHWDVCLLGSDYNLAFFLNAILHQAPPDVLRRSVQDFGGQLVQAALPQIVNRCSVADFDQITDLVLPKLSAQFLDRALAQRLETVDARSLVNALARAERLGYDVSDIVVERMPDKPEQVVPSLQGVMPPDFAPTNGQFSEAPAQQLPAQEKQAAATFMSAPTKPGQPNWLAGLPPVPREGPGGIHYCSECRRPCSAFSALQYHRKKGACDPFFRFDRLGRNLCTHCGHGFSSSTGLLYHAKVGVCGKFSEETTKLVTAELQSYVDQRESRIAMIRSAKEKPVAQTPQQQKFSGLKAEVRQFANQQHAFHPQPQGAPQPQSTPQPRSTSKDDNAYAHLNPDALKRFKTEVQQAEEKYGKLMREALLMSEPERSKEMAKWKNCYNTKQSMTRKKYGIRLREKRTQDEIDAERRRLLGDNGPEKWLEMERSAKRPRTDGGPSSKNASPLPSSSSTPQPSQSLTPRKRVALADMGGLSGSVGSAETTDPTTLMTSNEPRGLTHLQQSQAQANGSPAQLPKSTQDVPMTLQDDGSGGDAAAIKDQNVDGSSSDSESDGSEGDIPAH